MKTNKVALIILDGWGLGSQDTRVNAILSAPTHDVDTIMQEYPTTQLLTHGENVGLPDGQMGNSEVGHMNIGAGRVVYQQLVRINKAFRTKEVYASLALHGALAHAQAHGKKVHLIGLLSNGGVHAHIDHFKGIIDFFSHQGFHNVYVHAFTDGRDTDPKSGLGFVNEIDAHLKASGGQLATVIGRYYAMDRDGKWDRIALAYHAMVNGKGDVSTDMLHSIDSMYHKGITDEFLPPIVYGPSAHSGRISTGDVVINLNFRTDRGRLITRALCQEPIPEHQMKPLDIRYITMTEYDASFSGVEVLFPSIDLTNSLGEVVSRHGCTQLRIAETEKYPHVTYFFSGGRENPFEGEQRIMVPSPKVPTYDLSPEMSAWGIAAQLQLHLLKNQPDLVVLNFANTDMVGHTGVFGAVEIAAACVSTACRYVLNQLLDKGYACLVTADHGNAEQMVNPDGSPHTAHSTNPVPLALATPDKRKLRLRPGILADLAPTILALMGLPKPDEMDGQNLIDPG
ncbi:MAG: 2,3-bisphosphoglycerate-independent phosphoglycerate mutase [Bacteroidetes bacterium]|nr:2,3-bisphosphoglycerate-independent phosphoglycerate mutase [Bacteroidota bacterium]